ncbi:Fe-S osidoreductase [Candidatus Nitromaritima sp. SCGC AAA799-C22]|nr:Fe-S osidoreductase [Candidatus Nitromaritima sp. SCGC AAA799-C22]
MADGIDLLIISPGNNKIIYQDLAKEYSAIEPPVWAGLLAKFARNQGHDTVLIDQEAQGLSPDQIAQRGLDLSPKLVVIVVYGQQPSASTQNMTMAEEICSQFRSQAPHLKTLMIGGHVSALPKKTLEESDVDFVCQGEGPHTLQALLQVDDLENSNQLAKVPGLWYRQNGGAVFSGPSPVIPEKELPVKLNGIAWDMLPMDVYRAHNWHCFDHINERTPYATLYTSLGCPFKCTFCCINAPFGKPSIRYWDPDFVITELDILATKYGVKNIKIADEMFVLQEDHVMRLCDLIIERGYDFNFWAYARVDTVKDRFLEKLKKAGFNWLCLGIESKSKHVRDGAQKGHYNEQDIIDVVRKIQNAGIYIIANYMFGLPDDNYQSMRETLNLSKELNCEWANFYSGMAYPGSKLYDLALQKGWALPEKWHDFSQHSYEQLPLATDHLTAGQVLSFRDTAWQEYFTNPAYLNMVKSKFGQEVFDHINKLTSHKLKRKFAA